MKINIGCCGYSESKRKYFEEFQLVEIQQTFYQLPRLELARKWRKEAPEDFEFTLKAWQLITHEPSSPTYRRLQEKIPEPAKARYGSFKPTREVLKAWERTEEIARALAARIIVFQCPSSFQPTIENKANLRRFFETIDREHYLFAWEPRGKWSPEEVKTLCSELDLIHCVDPFKNEATYGPIYYFRLHGRTGYKYRYTEEDFAELLKMCAGEKEVYCLFNNVYMLEDARRFKELCGPKT
ncbi:MAG: DUF72 domain-containing protein [candidate division KSB1 bacterium]|nr:DUF72 domain-containing protein [candidate division KSB1 bacterium]